MSNTISLPRENFSMKYRIAATAICAPARWHSSEVNSRLRCATSAAA
jgi:hypothetical protein